MKIYIRSIMEDFINSFKLIKGTLFSRNIHTSVEVISVRSEHKYAQLMKRNNKTENHSFSAQVKTLLFVTIAILMAVTSLKAQIINEGFEEPIWTNFGTGPGASTYGSVVMANVPANSIMSYLTGGTSYTTATNTCNNSGTWFFSKATTQSSSKYGAGAHSISHSIKISGGGYIITPVTPAAVVNITFWASNSSGAMVAGLATDPAAASPGYNTSTTAAPGAYTYATSSYPNGINTMQSYSFGGTFSGPCRFGIFNPGGTIYVDDIEVYAPTGNPPTVVTVSATPAITNANVTGTVTLGATPALPLLASGIIWSTSPLTGTVADTLQPKTKDFPAATGTYTDVAGPIQPGTLYYTEAYVIGLDGSFYVGSILQFTTKALAPPVVTTTSATNVLSNKANVGGVVVDSGGLPIKNEVFKYGTNKASLSSTASPTPNPAATTTFSTKLVSLQPNTKYYYQACATNSLGTSCGNLDSFITSAPVPTLTAVPNVLNFGDIIYNTTSPILSYTLTGDNFPTTGGTVTVSLSTTTAYIISFSASSFTTTPGNSLNISFTGSKFKKTVYVKLLTGNYGLFTATVNHYSSLVAAQDADIVNISGNIIPSPDQLSNMGTDFWTGFGYEEKMQTKSTKVDDIYGLTLYIAAGNQTSNVVVDLPLLPASQKTLYNFPRTINIPANTVATVQGFPIGDFSPTNTTGTIDSRLYYTGVTDRGIHIQSTNGTPIAVWMYDYATNNSAGGSMLFPSNTWNSSYTVQAYGGYSNNSNPNSYFFVIANQDATQVTFTPSNDIINSTPALLFADNNQPSDVLYHRDSTYTITLNAGQIFNAMGYIRGTGKVTQNSLTKFGDTAGKALGLDLSGTIIKTTCDKKIAVFGGNGRCLLNSMSNSTINICNDPAQGSDNLIQQMLPKVAWGTYYLTVPTKTMEYNVFRITVSDPTTQVKVNGSIYTNNWNPRGLYYEYESRVPSKIESNKPINVTQFITSGDCQSGTIGNNGSGDPEMIILSPVQQAVKNTTVYTPDFKHSASGGSDYINVVIPKSGVSSFKLDPATNITQMVDTGQSSYTGAPYAAAALIPIAKAFITHPLDPNYSWAKFRVNYPAAHTLTSNVAFNAIAYGVEDGESWGYNAGTAINNLSSIGVIRNPFGTDTSSSVIHTCRNNPVTIQVALPYLPSLVDSILWSTPVNANINHSDTTFRGDIMIDPNNPTKMYADTSGVVVVNGQTFYLYTCKVPFSFSDYGFYPITATAYGTFASDCPGIDAHKIYIQVSSDNIDFKAIPAGCGSKNVTFTDSSTAMAGTSIVKWTWSLGDTLNKLYTSLDSNNRITFTNPHTYPDLLEYWAKLTTINSVGCYTTDSVYVDLAFGITAKFVMDRDTICPGTTVTFTDSSSANSNKWVLKYGDGTSDIYSGTPSTPLTFTHTYKNSGIYIDTLQVFTSGGCPSKLFIDTLFVATLPKPNFTFGGVCLPGSTLFANTSDSANGLKPYTYSWNFGEPLSGVLNSSTTTDGLHTYTPPVPSGGYIVKLIATNALGCVDSISQTVSTIYSKPIADFSVAKSDICLGTKAVFTDNNNSTATNQTINQWHWFFGDTKDTITTTNTAPHIYGTLGTDSVKLVIQTDKGCVSDTSIAHAIKINPLPTAAFIVPGSCLTGGSVTFTDQSSVTPDDGTNQPFTYNWSFGATTKDGTNTYTTTGTYQISETVTTAHGCSNTVTQPFVIAGSKPRPYFYVNHKDSLCSGLAVTISDTSRIDVGTIGRVDIVWDVANNPNTIVTVPNPGNGKPGTSTNYSHTYPGIGTYTIKEIVYAGTTAGCEDSVTLITPITIYPQPTATFVVPGSCLSSGAVTFTDQSTITPDDGTNQPFTYSWVYDPNATPTATGTTKDGVINTFKLVHIR